MGIPCVGDVLSLALVLLAGVPLPLGKWTNIRQFPYFVHCPWHFTVVVPLNPNNNYVRWKLWSPLYRWENQDKERTRNSFRFPSQWVVELCQLLSPYSLDRLLPPSCLRPVSLLWLSNCVSFVLFLAPVSQVSRTTFERPDQPIRVSFQPRTSPNCSVCWVLAALSRVLPTVPEGGWNAGQVETSPNVVFRDGIFFSLSQFWNRQGPGLLSGWDSSGLDDLFIRWLWCTHYSAGICCRGK